MSALLRYVCLACFSPQITTYSFGLRIEFEENKQKNKQKNEQTNKQTTFLFCILVSHRFVVNHIKKVLQDQNTENGRNTWKSIPYQALHRPCLLQSLQARPNKRYLFFSPIKHSVYTTLLHSNGQKKTKFMKRNIIS